MAERTPRKPGENRQVQRKIQVQLDDASHADANELVQDTGVRISKIVQEGISLVAWMTEQHKMGKKVYLRVEPDGTNHDYYLTTVSVTEHTRRQGEEQLESKTK